MPTWKKFEVSLQASSKRRAVCLSVIHTTCLIGHQRALGSRNFVTAENSGSKQCSYFEGRGADELNA